MIAWLLVPAAYIIGSVQWGLYLVRLTNQVDVRTIGSGKTGTTNVLRAAGKFAAAIVLVADATKGYAIVLLARTVSDNDYLQGAVLAAVIAGHIWPILASFKGGRGIATGVGAIAGLDPSSAGIALSVFIPVVIISRYVSLGSVLSVLAAIITFGVNAFAFDKPLPHFWFVLLMGIIIIGMHHDNLRRLVAGTERRLGH